MAKKRKKFDATAFEFGANAPKPKKTGGSRFGMKKTASGRIYFSGGGSNSGGKTRKSNRFSAAGGS